MLINNSELSPLGQEHSNSLESSSSWVLGYLVQSLVEIGPMALEMSKM